MMCVINKLCEQRLFGTARLILYKSRVPFIAVGLLGFDLFFSVLTCEKTVLYLLRTRKRDLRLKRPCVILCLQK